MKSMKQPREDVAAGVRREDDLLSLDDRAVAHRDALLAMARHLHSACLVGDPAPVVARIYERITHPEVGDLVAETSAFYSADVDHRVKGLGILLEHRDEWWQTDAEWAAERAKDDWLSEEDRLVDHAWYIQYGPKPEDVCRWVNCSFVTVPTDPRMFSTPIGQRDGNGITITRGDVVDGLADSGFKLRLPHE